jgi:hypothetical protein
MKRSRDRAIQEAQQARELLGQRDTPADTDPGFDTGSTDYNTTPAEPNPELTHSLETAQKTYGPAFNQAYAAFVDHVSATRDMDAYNRVMNSAHPGEELVRWHAENPYAAAVQEGRESQQARSAQMEHDDRIRVQTEFNVRAQQLAAQTPDYQETISSVDGMYDWQAMPVLTQYITRSPVGPEIEYLMAKDMWSPNSLGIFEQVQAAADNPIEQARRVGALEQVIFLQRQHQSSMMQRATKAPPPLAPVRGGANAPRDLHTLASKDDASDYINSRRASR